MVRVKDRRIYSQLAEVSLLTLLITGFICGIVMFWMTSLSSVVWVCLSFITITLLTIWMVNISFRNALFAGIAVAAGYFYTIGYQQHFLLPTLSHANCVTEFKGILSIPSDSSASPAQFHALSPVDTLIPVYPSISKDEFVKDKFRRILSANKGKSIPLGIQGVWKIQQSPDENPRVLIQRIAMRPTGSMEIMQFRILDSLSLFERFELFVISGKTEMIDWPVNQLTQLLPQKEASLLLGIVFGQTSGIDSSVTSGFTVLGITHLLAASGANIGALIVPIRWLGKKLRLRRGIQRGIILCCVWGYAVLAGQSVSICRAALIVTLFELRPDSNYTVSFYRLMLATLLICLLTNPFSLFDISFQLTFTVTMGLITLTKPLQHYLAGRAGRLIKWNWFYRLLPGVIIAESLSIPIIAFYFNQWSYLSVVTNLILTPFIEMLVPIGLSLILISSVFPQIAVFPAKILSEALLLLNELVTRAGHTPGLSRSIVVSNFSLALYYGCIVLVTLLYYVPAASIVVFSSVRDQALQWRGWLIRFGCAVAVLEIGSTVMASNAEFMFADKNKEQAMQVWFFDLKQGDAELIKLPNGQWVLINGGGSNKRDVLLQNLRSLGVNRLDAVILTDASNNHTTGLLSVLNEISISKIFLTELENESVNYQSFLAQVQLHQIPTELLADDSTLSLSGGSIKVIKTPARAAEATNSLLYLTFKGSSILIANQIDKIKFYMLMPDIPSADIVGITSFDGDGVIVNEFINRVHPSMVIQAGKPPKAGGSTAEALDLLVNAGVNTLRTNMQGTIHLSVSSNKIVYLEK